MVGLSCDTPEQNKAFHEKVKLPFDLLCDPSTEAAQALGVWAEQEWKGEKYMGLTRSSILVGEDGRIRAVLQGMAPGDHAAAVLRALGR